MLKHIEWIDSLAGLSVHRLGLMAGLVALSAAAPGLGEEINVHWPSFRGPQASGIAEGFATATEWDGESGRNVLWKREIPGLGHSSPVIYGDRLCVTTALSSDEAELKTGLYGSGASASDDGEQSWKVLCFDKRTGEPLWQRTAHQGKPKIHRHPKSSHANSSVAMDADHVVAFFGSEGLFVYDGDGDLRWKKDFGVLHSGSFRTREAQWGFGSSPLISGGKLVVGADVLDNGFLAVFDLKDGRQIWRVDRQDHPTWSTPTVYPAGDRFHVAVNGFKHMGAYDLADGSEIWKVSGGGDVPVPTPIYADGLVYLTNAHGAKAPVYAVRATARGNLNQPEAKAEHVAWSVDRGGAYMQTPLVYGDELYVCRDNGTLSVYDAGTGTRHYRQRLTGSSGFTASAVAADGKVYLSSEDGETWVLGQGKTYRELAVNDLGEAIMATPAISEGVLYFRTRRHLIAIGVPSRDHRDEAEAGSRP